MDRAVKVALKEVIGAVFVLALAVGPVMFLLWSWRRCGSRRRLALHAALWVPVVFALCGALDAGPEVAKRLREPAPPGGFRPAEAVAYKSLKSGAMGVGLMGLVVVAWVPVAATWRRLHPASFRRVVRPGPGGRPSAVEQDYGDSAAVEPSGAPDPRTGDDGVKSTPGPADG